MSEKNFCKNCLNSVMVPEEFIEELVKETEEELSGIVVDQIYEARLKECLSCPSLLYGTTCAHSGSIVRYRAKFKNKSCPFPGESKWKEIV